MQETLEALEREFQSALGPARGDLRALDDLRVAFLGRRGKITELMRGLGALPKSERPAAGQEINALKSRVQGALEEALQNAESDDRARRIEAQQLDVTLPGRRPWRGSLHPVTRARRELERVFRELGFSVETGPEVEDDFHNFQALNMPPNHPARDAQDTFYLRGGLLLRTHTSPVQIRTMERVRPPLRMICPGRVYRRDMDATHLPMFHQLEALVVGRDVTMADLKGTLESVWKRYFGAGVEMRLRPGYFPFVEPGCEYDITCQVCGGDGCRVCKQSGFIELGGAGMVHPEVFRAVDVDPDRYSGFAFGLGLDRIAMMRYGIDDLRLLVENDVRFLSQFPL